MTELSAESREELEELVQEFYMRGEVPAFADLMFTCDYEDFAIALVKAWYADDDKCPESHLSIMSSGLRKDTLPYRELFKIYNNYMENKR